MWSWTGKKAIKPALFPHIITVQICDPAELSWASVRGGSDRPSVAVAEMGIKAGLLLHRITVQICDPDQSSWGSVRPSVAVAKMSNCARTPANSAGSQI